MKTAKANVIPGSAQDDYDKLKILLLRDLGLDLTTHFEIRVGRRKGGGHGWTVQFWTAGCATAERSGPVVTEIIEELVGELTRKILLRWRSDGGALQLAGVPLEAFDKGPEIVETPVERDPAAPQGGPPFRNALPAR